MALGNNIALLMVYLLLTSMVVGYFASGSGYGPNPNTETSSSIEKQEFYPGIFSLQGVIYCKSASGILSLEGGVIMITCLGLDKYGYETAPFSILSRPTDGNGYFLAKVSSQTLEDDGVKITQCKVFLHTSPLKTCSYATGFNNGSSGAPLSAYRTVGSDDMRLYTVGPFVYSSDPPHRTPSRY